MRQAVLAAVVLFVAVLHYQPPTATASGAAVRSGHLRPHAVAASAGNHSTNRTSSWTPFAHVRELEEFCSNALLPSVVTDGDRVTTVSRVLLTRLQESFNLPTLNATLRHEFRRLGFAAPPDPTVSEIAVWAAAGVRPGGADERTGLADFLRYAVMFCRSAALVMDTSPSPAGVAVGSSGRGGGGGGGSSKSSGSNNATASVRWDFCRRVGFVHIPKTGGTSVMHVLTRAALQHSRRLLLTANSLFVGFRSNYPHTRKPFKNHHPALRQVRTQKRTLASTASTWGGVHFVVAFRVCVRACGVARSRVGCFCRQ
jgi:hypothetical protein